MEIGIVFGGKSYEHEISIVSAIALKKVLTCKLIYIFCDANREFYLIPTESINAKRFSDGSYKKDPKLTLEQGGFTCKGLFGSKKVACDVVLNLIHGADGEDGKLAGLFSFFGVPFIGPRLEASVLSYSKLWTKHLAQACGVKALPYELLTPEKRTPSLAYPLIVKPLRLGSSIGVSVVRSEKTLDYALDVAFEYDDTVIVEPFMEGVKEYNLAGCFTSQGVEFSIIEAPQKGELLDFDKKYLDFSRTATVSKAALEPLEEKRLQEAFTALYMPLFQGALIRCDFFMIDGEVILNEINPNPGSMANYLFEDFDGLVRRLANALPAPKEAAVSYQYIHSIHSAKGKL
ncbi:MAG: D-alanine--D-alanine ligase [Campylobacterales bacterium]|nr:D-alanine--D-alanine ligase [Campylobacterales bacterium]